AAHTAGLSVGGEHVLVGASEGQRRVRLPDNVSGPDDRPGVVVARRIQRRRARAFVELPVSDQLRSVDRGGAAQAQHNTELKQPLLADLNSLKALKQSNQLN